MTLNSGILDNLELVGSCLFGQFAFGGVFRPVTSNTIVEWFDLNLPLSGFLFVSSGLSFSSLLSYLLLV